MRGVAPPASQGARRPGRSGRKHEGESVGSGGHGSPEGPDQVDGVRLLEQELTNLLSSESDLSGVDLDSIANLALLAGEDYSALSNSVFAVKRPSILERDKSGSYILVCTRNVFLKYYSPAGEQQLHFWSAEDRSYYLEAMRAVLGDYLLADEEVPRTHT